MTILNMFSITANKIKWRVCRFELDGVIQYTLEFYIENPKSTFGGAWIERKCSHELAEIEAVAKQYCIG